MDVNSPDLTWFTNDRFGLFIHWGLYALAARHEWVQTREMQTAAAYQKYFDHFYPDLFDPTAWAASAKQAGMKYVVIVTKHHDGFCLWDSALTDFKATNTPYGQDLLRQIVDAFRAEGFKIGFYYSLLDWHHPEFPIDILHPMREDLAFREQEKDRDIGVYREYLFGQTRELLTQFGKIDIMWYDFSYRHRYADWAKGKGAEEWGSVELMQLVRELQPGIIINDRLDIAGDFVTPEQYQPFAPMQVEGEKVVWEACQTMNHSWGYDRDELDWKSAQMLLELLIDSVSKNGNLLLNVGPNGRGEFQPEAFERLRFIGDWMRLHQRAIYGCRESQFSAPNGTRYTQNGNRLYVHCLEWPFGHLHLPELAGRVAYAQFLHDASEIKMNVIGADDPISSIHMGGMPADTLTLELPVQRPQVGVPVVELFLKV
jgi:alpha-L-fucosidase